MRDSNRKYRLVKIYPQEDRYIKILYQWHCNEDKSDYFTCRPVKKYLNFDEYMTFISDFIDKGVILCILTGNNNGNLLIYGKISLFDYNPRNHSAEFGYYLPQYNRGQGLGKTMIEFFLKDVFNNNNLDLHKLYATTASGNITSIRILEELNFHLDGRLRDHYWIRGEMQDQLHYSLLKKEWEVGSR